MSKKSYPPNHLKRFIHRNPEIPDDSDSEYGSDNEDSVPALQESGIGSQESVPENPSDATTVLYPNPDEGDTLLSHTLIDDPGHTLPKMTAHIPIHTPSCNDDDEAFLPDLAETEPATPVPVCTERTLLVAEILADLAEGCVASDHDESAQSLDLQLEVSTTSEQQAKDAEEDVVNTQEVDVENTQYEDQTMETIDVDLIVNSVEDLKPMMFYPFSLYMRKKVATTVNINVGRTHGLWLIGCTEVS